MAGRDFRIEVRGEFKDLTEAQRADLLGRAAEHDAMTASFTREGHLSHDLAARPSFTFRFAESGDTDEDLVAATARAEGAARSCGRAQTCGATSSATRRRWSRSPVSMTCR